MLLKLLVWDAHSANHCSKGREGCPLCGAHIILRASLTSAKGVCYYSHLTGEKRESMRLNQLPHIPEAADVEAGVTVLFELGHATSHHLRLVMRH